MLIRRLAYILVGCMLICAIPSLKAAPSKESAKPFTVVIDAGHGGKDAGAVDNNVKEKDINLGVAKELAAKIKKGIRNVKVVMTRDNDSFISLQGRADKANKAKADLFISIHTNSLDLSNKNRKSVAGASVYALGLHKDANNMAVARRENSVIELEKNSEQTYSGFDPESDESYIIFEMAQKKNLSQSIKFADEVQKQLVETAGRRNRGVHQAGFWVLWATSMPAVLVELDFICNPNSAKFMASEQGQDKLAEAIYKAVKKYAQNLRAKSSGKTAHVENDATSTSNDAETVVLATASTGSRKVSDAPERTSSGYVAARRRRRSNASRVASDRRNLETSSITINTHPSAVAAPKTETRSATSAIAANVETKIAKEESVVAKVTAKRDSGKKKEKPVKKVTRVVNNRVVSVTENPANSQPKKAVVKKVDQDKGETKTAKKKADDKSREETDKIKAEVKEAFSKSKVKKADSNSRINRGSLRGKNR